MRTGSGCNDRGQGMRPYKGLEGKRWKAGGTGWKSVLDLRQGGSYGF